MKSKGKTSEPVSGDDRNLVAVDQNFSEADFSDKLFLFWSQYQKVIIVAIVAVFVLAIGSQVVRGLAAQKNASIQAEYLEVGGSVEALSGFAKKYPSHSLSSVAAIEAGDKAFEAENYDAAATQFTFAIDNAKSTEVVARASISRAMSYHAQGKSSEAIKELQAVLDNSKYLDAHRAQAGFYLSSIHLEAGNTDEVTKVAQKVDALESDSKAVWIEAISMIESRAKILK